MPNNPKVVKLAQPGFDVKTAGDENLIYNSNWPLLKIYKQGSAIIPDVTQSYTVTTHDLKFTPFFFFFSNATLNTWLASGAISNERRSDFFGPIGDGFLGIDHERLFYTPQGSPGTSGSLRIYYYIFALDLSTPYKAPIIKTGGVGGGDSKTVFKLAKESKDTSSNDLDDYIVHSRARSPLIHSVTPGTIGPDPASTTGFGLTVYHDLGYSPLFFGFEGQADGSYIPIPTGVSFIGNDKYVQKSDVVAGDKISIVILKDPFEIDYSVSVTV
jgi:hypothetical protein